MTDAIIQRLLKLAKTQTCYEAQRKNGNEYCFCALGNYEFAFIDGTEYGEILLAREILDNLAIDYK